MVKIMTQLIFKRLNSVEQEQSRVREGGGGGVDFEQKKKKGTQIVKLEAKRENGGNACDVCSSSSPNKLKTITRGSDKNPQLGFQWQILLLIKRKRRMTMC